MSVLAAAKPVHAKWSEVNREFLDFVEKNPACLDRESFASLAEEPTLHNDVIQPWPLFVEPARWREVGAVAAGMDGLVKGSIERLLGNDPRRIVEYFRHTGLTEAWVAMLLEEPTGIGPAPSRADYIETAEGLRCVEFNAGRCLGGTQIGLLGEMYLECPPTARFLRERGRSARPQAALSAYLRHVVEDTERVGLWPRGDFTLAVVIRPSDAHWEARHTEALWLRELARAVEGRRPGARARLFFCGLHDFEQDRGGALSLHGHPVNAVMDRHDGTGDVRHLFRAFKLGSVNLFGSPVGALLGDKRNLALLSTHADSADFTADERALLERHLPWSRMVAPARTTFRGRPLRLPDDLVARREEFVLKQGVSLGGKGVIVGRYTPPDEWTRAVARAVAGEDWIAQEYLETVPYWFQSGEAGAARHEVVWGLFVFGKHFGGIYLRMHAAGGFGGVVNGGRGAEIGTLLEVVA